MLQDFDSITARQFKDCAESVFKKKKKFVISEMFSCELKFNCDILKKQFSKEFTRRFLELDTFSKTKTQLNGEKQNAAFVILNQQLVLQKVLSLKRLPILIL